MMIIHICKLNVTDGQRKLLKKSAFMRYIQADNSTITHKKKMYLLFYTHFSSGIKP